MKWILILITSTCTLTMLTVGIDLYTLSLWCLTSEVCFAIGLILYAGRKYRAGVDMEGVLQNLQPGSHTPIATRDAGNAL